MRKLDFSFDYQLEVDYANQRFLEGRAGFAIFFWVMAFVNPLFILVVLERAEDPFMPILFRIILEMIIFLVLLCNYKFTEMNHRNYPYFYGLPMLIIYLYIIIMGHYSHPNFYALFLPNVTIIYFFVSTSFTGLRFKQSIFINLITMTIYWVYASYLTYEPIHKLQLPALGALMIVSFLVGFLIERFNRRLFLNSKTIEQINQELSDRNELKNSLISVLSHDINSPLTSIKSLLHLFREKEMCREEILSYWDQIDQSVDRVLNFTKETIGWIKKQMTSFQPNIQTHDSMVLVDNVIQLCQAQAQIKQIEIINHVSSKKVKTDEEIFKIALRNLLSNAIKYSYSKSCIEISDSATMDAYKVSVKDFGKGISPKRLNQIFTKHMNEPGTNNERGTGLGLSFSKMLMQRLGGTILVDSKQGEGSCFSLEFSSQ